MNNIHPVIVKFTKNELLFFEELSTFNSLKLSTFLNQALSNEMKEFEKETPNGIFVEFLEEEERLKNCKFVNFTLYPPEELFQRVIFYSKISTLNYGQFIRFLLLPVLKCYKEGDDDINE